MDCLPIYLSWLFAHQDGTRSDFRSCCVFTDFGPARRPSPWNISVCHFVLDNFLSFLAFSQAILGEYIAICRKAKLINWFQRKELETDMTNVNSSFQTNYKDVSHSLLNLDETHEIVSRGAGISYRTGSSRITRAVGIHLFAKLFLMRPGPIVGWRLGCPTQKCPSLWIVMLNFNIYILGNGKNFYENLLRD